MTLLAEAPPTPDPFDEGDTDIARHPDKPPQSPRRRAVLFTLVGALACAALRVVSIGRAYDVYVDEFFYMGLGSSVRRGHIPPHYPPGWGASTTQAFLLHPPGFFMLTALWQTIAGTGGDIFHQLYVARGVNVVMATLTCGLLFWLGHRLAGRWAGLTAAVLFTLDPYILRQNGRLLLETSTLFWIVAGYLVLVGNAQGRFRRPRRAAVVTGLLFGVAIITKDAAVIETLGALLVLAVLGWGIPRRQALLSAVASLVPYTLYVGICLVQGLANPLWSNKTLGIRRMLGLVQSTGFNKPGSVPLSSTLWSQAASYGASYFVVALGTLAAIVLLRSRRHDYRILGVFVASAAALVGYAVLFGTIEEQFLYFLSVPALLSLAVAGTEVTRRAMTRPSSGPKVRALLAVALIGLCVWNIGVWLQTRTTPDDATQQAVAWLDAHASMSEPVAYTTYTQSTTITATGLRTVPLSSPALMASDNVRYLVMSPKIIDQHYSLVASAAAAWYRQHSHIVFSVGSRSEGTLAIYETNDPTVW